MEKPKNEKLTNLLISELKDMFDAEKQIVDALPEAIDAADSTDLSQALKTHLGETKNQIQRLERIFAMMQVDMARFDTCEAMEGLIHEVKEAIQAHEKSALRDAAMISKLQRIEHYEISVYGTMRTFAKELDLNEVRNLLQESLDEEANADKTLTKIAEGGLIFSGVNRKANE